MPLSNPLIAVLLPLGVICVVVLLITAIVSAVRHAIDKQRREEFFATYHVQIPDDISLSLNDYETRKLVLYYPVWRFPNKDGSRNKRRSYNDIVYRQSEIYLDEWVLRSSDMFAIYGFANVLRQSNCHIPLCHEENVKRDVIIGQSKIEAATKTIDGIISCFADNPTDFEQYCADLFRKLGYDAKVTPPVADGGYDIDLYSQNGQHALVECKCYGQTHKIGRPLLQKLSGANATQNAETLIFVTTSDFSKPAIQYAHETGIKLINGSALMNMRQQVGEKNTTAHFDMSDIILTDADIMSHYPPDYQFGYAYA